MSFFKALKSKLIEFFFPNITCHICNEDLCKKTKTHICDSCKHKLVFVKNPCKKCGKTVGIDDSCRSCNSRKYYFDRAVSVVEYDDIGKNCIYKLKMHSQRYVADFMGYYMYCAFINAKLKADCILSVPMTKKKIKERGYNQASDLLESCNRYLKLEDLSDCLVQKVESVEQKDLDARDRFAVAKEKYKLVKYGKFKDRSVIIVDDVLTTGATTSAIAQILKYAGAKNVYVLTFATVVYDVEEYEFDDYFTA